MADVQEVRTHMPLEAGLDLSTITAPSAAGRGDEAMSSEWGLRGASANMHEAIADVYRNPLSSLRGPNQIASLDDSALHSSCPDSAASCMDSDVEVVLGSLPPQRLCQWELSNVHTCILQDRARRQLLEVVARSPSSCTRAETQLQLWGLMHTKWEEIVALQSQSVDAHPLLASAPAAKQVPIEGNPSSKAGGPLGLDVRVGVSLFLRVVQALERSTNVPGLMRVARQLPTLLANLPPLALHEDQAPGAAKGKGGDGLLPEGSPSDRPLFATQLPPQQQSYEAASEKEYVEEDNYDDDEDGEGSETNKSPGQSTSGIVDMLTRVLRKLLNKHVDELDGGCRDQAALLTSMLGLAIKRGSLQHILEAVQLLLAYGSAGSERSRATDGSAMQVDIGLFLADMQKAAPPTSVDSLLLELEDEEGKDGSGLLMSFGKGDHGKLGHGMPVEDKMVPAFVEGLRGVELSTIASLSTHSVAVTRVGGKLLTWGNGDKHRLGHGSAEKEHVPRVMTALLHKPAVCGVACGLGHTLALLKNGQVYAWGNGSNGRLGLGDTGDRSTACLVTSLQRPSTVVAAVYSGASHSMAVTDQGLCFTWGKNNQGQCGHVPGIASPSSDILLPQLLESLRGPPDASSSSWHIVQMAGGWEHTLALAQDGTVLSFGAGYRDSRKGNLPPVLGHGESLRQCGLPTAIAALKNVRVVHVACGWDHSLAVSSAGEIYSWGAGHHGKLGHGDEEPQLIPKRVEALVGHRIVLAEAGCEHTVVVTEEGHLYTWGQAESGRLGHGGGGGGGGPFGAKEEACLLPKRVEALVAAGLRVTALAVGDKYNLILVKRRGVAAAPQNQNTGKARGTVVGPGDDTGREGLAGEGRPWPLQRWAKVAEGKGAGALGCLPAAIAILLKLERLAMVVDGDQDQHVADGIQHRILTHTIAARDTSPAAGGSPLRRKWGLHQHIKPMGATYSRLLHRPFAIDSSDAVCRLLLSMLHVSCADILKPSGANQHQPPPSVEDAKATVCSKTNMRAKNSLGSGALATWVVTWCCLRLLRSNLRALVFRGLLRGESLGTAAYIGEAEGCRGPTDKTRREWVQQQEEDPAQATPPRHRQQQPQQPQSRRPQLSMTIRGLHVLLRSLCQDDMCLGFGAGAEEGSAVRLLRREAASILRAGFTIFYPSPESRVALLQELLLLPPGDEFLLPALADRLAQDNVMAPMVCHLATTARQATSRPEEEEEEEEGGHADKASRGPRSPALGLGQALEDLLAICCQRGVDGAGDGPEQPQPQQTRAPAGIPLLSVLKALQLHAMFWLCAAVKNPTGVVTPGQAATVKRLVDVHCSRVFKAAVDVLSGTGRYSHPLQEGASTVLSLVPVLLISLSALPSELLASFAGQVPTVMELMRVAKVSVPEQQQEGSTAAREELSTAATLFVSRLACDLAFSRTFLTKGGEDTAVLSMLLHESPLTKGLLQEAEPYGLPGLPLPSGGSQSLAELLAATRAWKSEAKETLAGNHGETDKPPHQGHEMGHGKPPVSSRVGSRSRLVPLPSPTPGSPVLSVTTPTGRPSTASSTGSTGSSRLLLANVMESSELDAFLHELIQGRGQARDLDQHLHPIVAADFDEGNRGSDVASVLTRTGQMQLADSRLADRTQQSPAAMDGGSRTDHQTLRQMLVALLLKSHGAVQQAATLARCLPRSAPMPSVGPDTSSLKNVPPLLLSIWRTAAGIVHHLDVLLPLYQADVLTTSNNHNNTHSHSKNSGPSCCSEHSADSPSACWVANLAFLLQAGSLEPISLIREDPATLLHKAVRRLSRAYPRADTKAVSQVLAILDGWRRQYERQQRLLRRRTCSDALHLPGLDIAPEVVPLHHVLSLVFLPCHLRRRLISQLSERLLTASVAVEGMDLMARLIGETPTGPALLQLMRTYTLSALERLSANNPSVRALPDYSSGYAGDQRASFQSSCLLLYKRLSKLLRSQMAELSQPKDSEDRVKGSSPLLCKSAPQERLVTVLLGLSVTLLLLKDSMAQDRSSKATELLRPALPPKGLSTTGQQQQQQQQLVSPTHEHTTPSGSSPCLAMALRLRLIPLISDILSGPGDLVKDDTSVMGITEEFQGLQQDVATGGGDESFVSASAVLADGTGNGKLSELHALLQQQDNGIGRRNKSGAVLLHEAAWSLLSLLISLLTDSMQSKTISDPSMDQESLSARSGTMRNLPIRQQGSFSSFSNMAPPARDAGLASPHRPSSATNLLRRSSLSSSSPSSSSSSSNPADPWSEETDVSVIGDLISSELHRVLPMLSKVLSVEARVLDLFIRNNAQLVVQRPPLPYSTALNHQQQYVCDSCPSSILSSSSAPCQLMQLQDLDDSQGSFSVTCWLFRPPASSDNGTPAAPTKCRRRVLFVRTLEVAFPSQLSDLGSRMDSMFDVAHPGVFLAEDDAAGCRLEFSVLAPAAGDVPTPSTRGTTGQGRRDRRRDDRGREEDDEDQGENVRDARSTSTNRRREDLGAAGTVMGHVRRYQKVDLSVSIGDIGWAPGTWAHICCSYESHGDPHSGQSGGQEEDAEPPKATMTIFVNGREVAVREGVKGHATPPLCTDMVLAYAHDPRQDTGKGAATYDEDGTPSKNNMSADPQPQHLGSNRPVALSLVDLCYLQRVLTTKDIKEAVEVGSFSSCSRRRKTVGRYTCRLLSAVHRSLQNRACLQEFATYPWIFLLMKLVKIGDTAIQVSILRLFRTLLPALLQQTKGPNLAAATTRRTLHKDLLEELLGLYRTARLLPLAPGAAAVTSEDTPIAGVAGLVDHYLDNSNTLLTTFKITILRRVLLGSAKVGNPGGSCSSTPQQQAHWAKTGNWLQTSRVETDYMAFASETVALMRLLWKSPSWRDALNATLEEAVPRSLSSWDTKKEEEKERGADSSAPVMLLLDALGAHMEGLRVGAAAVALHDDASVSSSLHQSLQKGQHSSSTGTIVTITSLGSTGRSSGRCGSGGSSRDSSSAGGGGTRGGDTFSVQLLTFPCGAEQQESLASITRRPQLVTRTLSDIVTVEEVAPLAGDEASPPPHLLLSVLKHALGGMPAASSSRDQENRSTTAPGALLVQMQAALLRSSAMRSLVTQLSLDKSGDTLVVPLLESSNNFLQQLLSLGASDPLAVAMSQLGKSPSARCSALALKLSRHGLVHDHLEAFVRLAWALWVKCRMSDMRFSGQDVQQLSSRRRRQRMECIGGEVAIGSQRVRALSHFPSVGFTSVSLSPLKGAAAAGGGGGRWFYEVVLITDGLMQIGWASPAFRCDPVCGQGVGDHASSWSFDGFRQKKWSVSSTPYGNKWRSGDVLGVLLDLDLNEMRFYLNGVDLGPAFVGFQTQQGLFPAASLNVGQSARFNFGQSPFIHPPSATDGLVFRPVIEGRRRDRKTTGDSSREGGLSDARTDSGRQLQARTSMTASGDEEANDSRQSSRRAGGGGEDSADSQESGGGHARRRTLIESLIGMGFPVEWAIRAVEHCDSSMSESMAIAWIIERMEMESAQLDADVEALEGGGQGTHASSSSGVMGGSYEDNEDGDDSDRGRRESRGEAQETGGGEAGSGGGGVLSANLARSGSTTNRAGRRYEQGEEPLSVDKTDEGSGTGSNDDIYREVYFAVSDKPACVTGEDDARNNAFTMAAAPSPDESRPTGERLDSDQTTSTATFGVDAGSGMSNSNNNDDSPSLTAALESVDAQAALPMDAEGGSTAATVFEGVPTTSKPDDTSSPPSMSPQTGEEPVIREDWKCILDGASEDELLQCLAMAHGALSIVYARLACSRLFRQLLQPTAESQDIITGSEHSTCGTLCFPLSACSDLPHPLGTFTSSWAAEPAYNQRVCQLLIRNLASPSTRGRFLDMLKLLNARVGSSDCASWFPLGARPVVEQQQQEGAVLWSRAVGDLHRTINVGALVKTSSGRGLVFNTGGGLGEGLVVQLVLTSLMAHAGGHMTSHSGYASGSATDTAEDRSTVACLVRLILEDLVLQAERARHPQFDKVVWTLWSGCRSGSTSSLTKAVPYKRDLEVLTRPDFRFVSSAWTALLNTRRVLLHRVIRTESTPSSQQGAWTGSERDFIKSLGDLVSPTLFFSLLTHAIKSTNLTLRHTLLALGFTLLSHVVDQLQAAGTSTALMVDWAPEDFLCNIRERRVVQMLAARLRKETDARILHSSYVQTLVSLLVQWQRLRVHLGMGAVFQSSDLEEDMTFLCWQQHQQEGDGPSPTPIEPQPPQLIVEDVGPTSISVSWGQCWGQPMSANNETPSSFQLLKPPLSSSQPVGETNEEQEEDHGKEAEVAAPPQQLHLQVAACSAWGAEPFTSVAVLSANGTHTIENLTPDIKYRLRLIRAPPADPSTSNSPGGSPSSNAQLAGPQCVAGPVVVVSTQPEKLFMFNSEAKGENLNLLNGNMTVRNMVNKKWNTVRATTAYSTGVHSWEVHVDRCVSKNIFVGIVMGDSGLDNYVGSDRFGWGYLANKAIWHSKSKMRTYGELFREGDTIRVQLDLDQGTLVIVRNGRELGVAVEGLKGEFYPAFSLYNKDDQLSLIPSDGGSNGSSSSVIDGGGGSSSSSNNASLSYSAPGGSSSSEVTIHRLYYALQLLECLPGNEPISSSSTRPALTIATLQHVLSRWLKWQFGGSCFVCTPQGREVELDPSAAACTAFGGLRCGDHIKTRKGTVRVVGATKHHLWVKADQLSSSSSSPCTSAMPLSRRRVRELLLEDEDRTGCPSLFSTKSGEGSMIITSADMTDLTRTVAELGEWFKAWTATMDEELCDLMSCAAEYKGVSPFALSPSQLLPTEPGQAYPSLKELPLSHIRARAALLLHINAVVLPMLPYVDMLQGPHCFSHWRLTGNRNSSATLADSEDVWSPGAVIRRNRFRLFEQTKVRLLTRLLQTTASPLPGSAQARAADSDLPRIRVTMHPPPASASSTDKVDGSGARQGDNQNGRTTTLIEQVAEQLQSLSASELRRQYLDFGTGRALSVSSAGLVEDQEVHVQPRAFTVELDGDDDDDDDVDDEDEDDDMQEGRQHRRHRQQQQRHAKDPCILYRQLFYRLGLELPASGMLCQVRPRPHGRVPSTGSAPLPPPLSEEGHAVNKAGGERYVPSLDFILSSEACTPRVDASKLSLFRALGQLMGVAIRTGTAFPLHLSSSVWELLVEEGSSMLQACGGLPDQDRDVALVCEHLKADWVPQVLPEGLRLVAPLRTGEVVPLVAGAPVVGFSARNAARFSRLCLELQTAECLPQVAAIYTGLTSVVPMHVLPLLNPAQLRDLVCGKSASYVRLLSDHVTYRDSCRPAHKAVQAFWACLSSMPVNALETLVDLFLRHEQQQDGPTSQDNHQSQSRQQMWMAFTQEAGPLHYGIRIDGGAGRTIWLQDDLLCPDKVRRSFERALAIAVNAKA